MFGGQQGQQPVLGMVHILVLVHQDVVAGVVQRLSDIVPLLQQPHGEQEEIVEIESVATVQHLLVGGVHGTQLRVAFLDIARPVQAVLGPRDPDVEETALLGHRLGVGKRALVGKDAVVEADEEYEEDSDDIDEIQN